MAESETTRLEAFSDGVFAIAITLLILEIKVPTGAEIQDHGLTRALLERWPSYLGYVISFMTIGVMWVNHHALFTYIRRVDRTLMLANLGLLMTVSFLPFPTAVLAEHLPDAAVRSQAAVFYGLTLVVIALAFNALWWAGRGRHRLLGGDAHAGGMRTITFRYGIGPLSYGTATVVAFFNVWVSLAIHFALALMYALSERRLEGEDTP
ncbi:MAG TPA: TMEM175 family protein [Gaiellales bacterium]|nr:TMEM175 family protein [Gaiellales bacterium]